MVKSINYLYRVRDVSKSPTTPKCLHLISTTYSKSKLKMGLGLLTCYKIERLKLNRAKIFLISIAQMKDMVSAKSRKDIYLSI